jgi:hypothetical protein
VQEVANTILMVASFVRSFEDYDLKTDQALRITWPEFGTRGVRLQAHSVRWKLYYRMDSTRPAGNQPFIWPISLLASMNISKRDIGVVGRTRYEFSNHERDVYLPLTINQRTSNGSSDEYHLTIWPGVELQEVYISLAPVDAQGEPTAYLTNGVPLRYGLYPPQRAIDIPIGPLPKRGMYQLEIGAVLHDGGVHTLDLLFYHAG